MAIRSCIVVQGSGGSQPYSLLLSHLTASHSQWQVVRLNFSPSHRSLPFGRLPQHPQQFGHGADIFEA